MKMRIRKNSLSEDVYLARNGKWGKWQDAAKFTSTKRADKFAVSMNVEIYGLFTQQSCMSQ